MRHLLAWVARFAASLLMRRVEVADLDRLPQGRRCFSIIRHSWCQKIGCLAGEATGGEMADDRAGRA